MPKAGVEAKVASRRTHHRYVLLSNPADFQGTIDEKRITIDAVYTFSKGGCSLLSSKPHSKRLRGKVLRSVFLFKPFSRDPFTLRCELVHISKKKIEGNVLYVHGLKFLDPEDPVIEAVLSALDDLEKSGHVGLQPHP